MAPKPGMNNQDDVVCATFITLIFAYVVTHIFEESYANNIALKVVIFIGYALVHPVLGRIMLSVMVWLCSLTDDLYEISTLSKWSPRTRLWIGILWPLCAAFIIPVTFIGLVWGYIIKRLYGSQF